MGDTARANPKESVLPYSLIPYSLIMNKSQETMAFYRAPEIDFRYKTKARNEMVY